MVVIQSVMLITMSILLYNIEDEVEETRDLVDLSPEEFEKRQKWERYHY